MLWVHLQICIFNNGQARSPDHTQNLDYSFFFLIIIASFLFISTDCFLAYCNYKLTKGYVFWQKWNLLKNVLFNFCSTIKKYAVWWRERNWPWGWSVLHSSGCALSRNAVNKEGVSGPDGQIRASISSWQSVNLRIQTFLMIGSLK